MGWLYYSRPRGESNRDHFQKQFAGVGRIVECATVKGTFYAAVENFSKPGIVWCLVCLIRWDPKNVYNFGCKDMDETMGPYGGECPEKVLRALTPTDNATANEWRARQWDMLAKRKNAPKLGETIRTKNPVTFTTNGRQFTCYQFTKEKWGRQRNVYRTEHGNLVRVPNLAFYERAE